MTQTARPFVIIGTPEDRRVTLFQEALARLDLPPACVIAYADLLEQRVDVEAAVPHHAIVRLESPGKSWEINRVLALRGGESAEIARRSGFDFPTLATPGDYVPSWAWYTGFCQCLDALEPLRQRSDLVWMQDMDEARLMFDKAATQPLFASHDIPSPAQSEHHATDVVLSSSFLKSQYGSSGTGIIAIQASVLHDTQRYKIYTSMALDNDTLINTRRLSEFYIEMPMSASLHEHPQFGPLLTRWAAYERDHVLRQTWIPKATVPGGVFDLRLVMIAGRLRHAVVRVSQTPITNLHLLNKRGDFDMVRERLSERVWGEIEHTCERVAALFPKSLYMGIDLLITPTWNRHYVLEVNAFGDLLPNLLHEGDDTYTAEIRAMLNRD